MGTGLMQAIFRKLEFDRRPSIELKERASTLWPSNCGRLTNMTVSYGHGIAVTPLHLASACAELVNGGIWRPATLLTVKDGKVARGRRGFSAATSRPMCDMLRRYERKSDGKKNTG